MYLNKVLLYGNITRDPEVRALPSGIKVTSLGLATNRVWKDKNGAKQESTDFHNIVLFGRQAETAAQYLKKGASIFVEGRIQNRSWNDKDGQKKYRTEVVAERFQFGPRPAGAGGSQGAPVKSFDDKSATPPQADTAGAIEYPEEEINPDDIPF
ncbi:MAG: single-stranded DNA-binding protein [Patescibacteria group bacterium]